jgi:hypothetical protein
MVVGAAPAAGRRGRLAGDCRDQVDQGDRGARGRSEHVLTRTDPTRTERIADPEIT